MSTFTPWMLPVTGRPRQSAVGARDDVVAADLPGTGRRRSRAERRAVECANAILVRADTAPGVRRAHRLERASSRRQLTRVGFHLISPFLIDQ
jgi:hypothetical protein